MNLERVRPPPSRSDGHLRLIVAFIGGALLAALIKPWGSGDQPAPVARAAPSPTATATPVPTPAPKLGYEGRAYDMSIFGSHEPEATWAIWPAGFLVTFGFVIQVPGEPAASASAGPAGSASPPPGATDPAWPARFDVPTGNHLLLIGINMPRGHRLTAVDLARESPSGRLEPVAMSRFPSPWPSHFAVIGIPTSPGDDTLSVWPAGQFRLEMTFDPGSVVRSMEISIVDAPPGG